MVINMIRKIINEIKKSLFRLIALFLSFIVGWVIYVVGVFSMPYAGFLGVLLQIVFGAVISGFIVLVSYLVGYIIKKYFSKIIQIDNGIRIFILLLSLLLLIFGNRIGLTQQYFNPETGEVFQSLNANIAIICYISIIFLIANWPTQKRVQSLMEECKI